MKKMLSILLLYTITPTAFPLVSWMPPDVSHGHFCNRDMLKGQYNFTETPYIYTYYMDDKVMERHGELAISLEYRKKWKEKGSCDHTLIETKVTQGDGCSSMAANAFHIGDRMRISVLDVNSKYMKYASIFKGKSHEIIMYRINEDDIFKKK
jgi:hypothetical protein